MFSFKKNTTLATIFLISSLTYSMEKIPEIKKTDNKQVISYHAEEYQGYASFDAYFNKTSKIYYGWGACKKRFLDPLDNPEREFNQLKHLWEISHLEQAKK